jgi:hypothetical protein
VQHIPRGVSSLSPSPVFIRLLAYVLWVAACDSSLRPLFGFAGQLEPSPCRVRAAVYLWPAMTRNSLSCSRTLRAVAPVVGGQTAAHNRGFLGSVVTRGVDVERLFHGAGFTSGRKCVQRTNSRCYIWDHDSEPDAAHCPLKPGLAARTSSSSI